MRETVRKFKETVEIQSSVFNRLKSHRYFPMALLLTVFLSAACFHVWQRVQVVELVKEVSQLKKDNAELLDLKKKTHSDIAALSTAARIERYSADSLGLKPINADRLFTLVPKKTDYEQPDDLDLMIYALNRVAESVPRISDNSALAGDVDKIELDTLEEDGAGR